MECRPTGFGTLAAVHRLKTDHLTITKKGGKVTSSVDSRLCVQCRPGAFRVNTNFSLQVGSTITHRVYYDHSGPSMYTRSVTMLLNI